MTDGIEITLISHIPEVTAKIKEEAKKRMLEAVQEVKNEVLLTLSHPGSGRQYKVPGTNTYYTASSPGEPPATATAALKDSIKWVVEGQGSQLVGMVGTPIRNEKGKDMSYAVMLEFGTKRMAARPWLRVSFEKAENKVKQIFEREWLK